MPRVVHGRLVSVGHAATYPFAYEMFGKEERIAVTHADSQTVQCHLGGCLIAVVTDASENIRPAHAQRDIVVARTVAADFWARQQNGQK